MNTPAKLVPSRPSSTPEVMLVAAEPRRRNVVRRMLQDLGYAVRVARSTSEALRMCLERAPKIMLVPLELPGEAAVRAVQILRRMQREQRLPRFPIIGAAGMAAAPALGTSVGMDGVVTQPLEMTRLAMELRAQLS